VPDPMWGGYRDSPGRCERYLEVLIELAVDDMTF
jgi:hypothetical protein